MPWTQHISTRWAAPWSFLRSGDTPRSPSLDLHEKSPFTVPPDRSNQTPTCERHVRDSARRGDSLDVVVLLETLESLPEANASAEQNRDHNDVHVVDEATGQEGADGRGPATDADVLAIRSLAGGLERIGWRRVQEVERRPALHLDRRTWVVREDEDRRMKRGVGTPPTHPLRVLVPSRRSELPRTHDLGADVRSEQAHEGIVNTARAAASAEHRAAPPRGELPFVQPFPGMAEGSIEALAFAGGEAVERDGYELDSGEGHGAALSVVGVSALVSGVEAIDGPSAPWTHGTASPSGSYVQLWRPKRCRSVVPNGQRSHRSALGPESPAAA